MLALDFGSMMERAADAGTERSEPVFLEPAVRETKSVRTSRRRCHSCLEHVRR